MSSPRRPRVRERDSDYDRSGYPTDHFPRSRREERIGSASCYLCAYVVVRTPHRHRRGYRHAPHHSVGCWRCCQCIFGVLYLDSSMTRQLRAGEYTQFAVFMGLIALSIFLYFYALLSYPVRGAPPLPCACGI